MWPPVPHRVPAPPALHLPPGRTTTAGCLPTLTAHGLSRGRFLHRRSRPDRPLWCVFGASEPGAQDGPTRVLGTGCPQARPSPRRGADPENPLPSEADRDGGAEERGPRPSGSPWGRRDCDTKVRASVGSAEAPGDRTPPPARTHRRGSTMSPPGVWTIRVDPRWSCFSRVARSSTWSCSSGCAASSSGVRGEGASRSQWHNPSIDACDHHFRSPPGGARGRSSRFGFRSCKKRGASVSETS